MTGFASLTREDDRATIGVTVRAVNHRFLDIQLRVPQSLADVEPRVRALMQKRLARGRVELQISVQLRTPVAPSVELNEDFANALSAAMDRARESGLVSGTLTPGDLLRLPQAISIRDKAAEADPEAEAQLAASVEAAVEQALADLDARNEALDEFIGRVANAAAEGGVDLQSRLQERVRALSLDVPVDEAMLAQEIIRTVQRSDISEEITRFRAHLSHWDALSESAEPCGRKLDFLLQEMNREVNTMGSKADGLRVSELIIAAKAELEKMREQVQNAE